MNIFIVSSGRPQKQITAEQISPNSKYLVTTVVPEREQFSYLSYQATASYLFHNQVGIKNTRQWLMERVTLLPFTSGGKAVLSGNLKVIVLDDDLVFYKRQEAGNFTKATPEDVELMFDEIDIKLTYFPHVGIVDKFMSQARPRGTIYNGRYNQLLAYNYALFPTVTPRYRVEVGEEQDFNLQLLSEGFGSCILTEWSKSSQNYASGGCGVWRTAEVERAAHEEMVKLWPGICAIKDNKSTISGTSLRINWRKAYVPHTDIHPV